MSEAPQRIPNPPDSVLATRWTRIGALQGQDAELAWQWFVERYRPFVRGILDGVLPRGHAAAAAEEFWGYVWMSGALQRADRDRRFRAFLSGIVRNFARSWSRQRGLPVAAEAALDALAAADGKQTEVALWVDNVVANALAALRDESPGTARALALFYGLGDAAASRGMSAAEVAAATGNTAQGIYMLLFRGRKRLRTLVEQELREGCGDDATLREELQELLGMAASKLPGLLEAT